MRGPRIKLGDEEAVTGAAKTRLHKRSQIKKKTAGRAATPVKASPEKSALPGMRDNKSKEKKSMRWRF